MRESMVMTVIGKDRPGLVGALSAIIEAHDGNWEESRMVQLAGEFAGLLHVHVPQARAAELERALSGLEGMAVTVARTAVARVGDVEPARADVHFLELEVVGHDRPGIVHRVAETLAARQVNVEELQSRVFSAPMSAEMLFEAKARLSAPKSVRLSDLQKDLEEIAADLMVEVEIAEGGG